MNQANAFLSYDHKDKKLVNMVAKDLTRRGVTPWVDEDHSPIGCCLSESLNEAIKKNAFFVVFLSKNSIKSFWVEKEIENAIHIKENNPEWKHRILPVYMGDPEELIRSMPSLANEWLIKNKDRHIVDRLGIRTDDYKNDDSLPVESKKIADGLAKSIYHGLKFQESTDVNIIIDQRGKGWRNGDYEVPSYIDRERTPTLIFRPDRNESSVSETLVGDDWKDFMKTIHDSLKAALGNLYFKKTIRIIGDGQLAVAFLLGEYFDRTNCKTLECWSIRQKTRFTYKGHESGHKLQGGDRNCETVAESAQDLVLPPKIKPEEKHESVALYIGKEDYLRDVKDHLESSSPMLPLVYVKSREYGKSEDVMNLVKDIVALLKRLKIENRTCLIRLYCDLPFNVVPILAANLIHTIDKFEFMEYRRDLQDKRPPAKDKYTHIPI